MSMVFVIEAQISNI